MRRAAALLVLAAIPGFAGAVGGDLCVPLPLEGWAMVGRWHVGSTARSAREGWLRPAFRAADWGRAAAGGWVPESPAGCWLRAKFQLRRSLWKSVALDCRGIPEGTRAFVNGTEVRWTGTVGGVPADILGLVRSGDNILMLVMPPMPARARKVPAASLAGFSAASGAPRTAALGPPWRVRADQVEAAIPPAWLKTADVSTWRISLPRPLAVSDDWLPRAPVCLKAVLDLPYAWAGRRFSVFLHGLAGSPEVWLNGEKLSGPVTCPARIDLGKRLKFNGHDTLCLVYPEPPAGPGDDGLWGVAALHWDVSVRPPRCVSNATVLFDAGAWAGQEGVRRALRYAAEAASVSATPCSFQWADAGATPTWTATGAGAPVGLVVAAWGATAYRAADIEAAYAAIRARAAEVAHKGMRIWVLAPPTVGSRLESGRNDRIRLYNRSLRTLVKDEGVRLITVYDVFYSSLKRMTTGPRARRWPVKVDLTDDEGTLGPQGAYLISLAILNEFALY